MYSSDVECDAEACVECAQLTAIVREAYMLLREMRMYMDKMMLYMTTPKTNISIEYVKQLWYRFVDVVYCDDDVVRCVVGLDDGDVLYDIDKMKSVVNRVSMQDKSRSSESLGVLLWMSSVDGYIKECISNIEDKYVWVCCGYYSRVCVSEYE